MLTKLTFFPQALFSHPFHTINFSDPTEKARESCKTSNHAISDHFVDANKLIPVPKGGTQEIGDIMLTRYACYLIAHLDRLQARRSMT